MDVLRIEEGLWRWTTPHPDWKPGADWGPEVGCVYWETSDAVVLVDPLVPIDAVERRRFLEAFDADVERLGLPVAVLLTCSWHGRSAEELTARYGGEVLDPWARGALPGDALAVTAPSAEEVVYWLPEPRSVVTGDALLGTETGLTLCPEAWLEWRGGSAQLVSDLAPLLDLPVTRVLTSHGPPVLTEGREALAQALRV